MYNEKIQVVIFDLSFGSISKRLSSMLNCVSYCVLLAFIMMMCRVSNALLAIPHINTADLDTDCKNQDQSYNASKKL